MAWGFLIEDFRVSRKQFVAITFLFSGTLLPFYLFHGFLFDEIFTSLSDDQLWACIGKALFYASATFSTVIGSLLSEKVERRRLLFYWMSFGVLTTALFMLLPDLTLTLFLSVLLGISFGLGIPSSFAFFADSTATEERGRVSGIVILVIFVFYLCIAITVSLFNLGLREFLFVCVILRATSFITLRLDPCERVQDKRRSWLRVLTSKGFVLYLIPWLIFNIADGVLLFVKYDEDPLLELLFRFIGFSVFAFISGVMVDRVGRKYPLILGFVMLGISYLFVGVATSSLSWLVMIFISSIAWSFFQNAYLWAVLGDLASNGSTEKVYALGWIVVFVVETSFRLLKGAFNLYAPANLVSSALGIITFIAIIPLIFAPETLPETQKSARRMREYLKRVGDLLQREEQEE